MIKESATQGSCWCYHTSIARDSFNWDYTDGVTYNAIGIRLVEVLEEEEKLMSEEVNAWVAEAVRSIDKILHEFGEENFKNKGLHGAIDVEGMARDLIARQPLEAGQCLEGLANLRGPGDRYAKAAYAVLTTIFSDYVEDDDDEWFMECRSACPSIDH